MDVEDESQIVEAAQGGDVGSLGILYERHYATMVWLAYSVLRDHSLAEDAAQEAFASACDELVALRRPEKFAGWLAAICRNVAYKMAKQRSREVTAHDKPVVDRKIPSEQRFEWRKVAMKSSDKDRRLDQLISRATSGKEDMPVPDFDKWRREHPEAVDKLKTQAGHLPSERLCGGKHIRHEPLLIRFPSLVWAPGAMLLSPARKASSKRLAMCGRRPFPRYIIVWRSWKSGFLEFPQPVESIIRRKCTMYLTAGTVCENTSTW